MKAIFRLSSDLEPIPDNQETLEWMAKHKDGDILSFEVKENKRTKPQNNSLHRYISELSKALNEGGYDVGSTVKVGVDFTPNTVKEYMVKPIMKALYPDKTSTTQLSTTEIQKVYENLNRATADKFGISLAWPSRFSR